MKTTFYDLGLHHEIIRSVSEMGFELATPIQAETIPAALEGKDLIGQAQTGTGKTAAFGMPIIHNIDTAKNKIQALIVTPTRELAVQVAEELNKIGQYRRIRTLPIYGGQDIRRQIRALQNNKAHIIVGTPGRLIDHIKRKTFNLGDVSSVVLDEADEMLNMGFIEDIEQILKAVPDERQTLLFSATMPKPIENLAKKFMNEPTVIKTKSKEVTVPNVTQEYIEVPEKKKFDVLTRMMDIHNPELAIVFGRTKRRVDELAEALSKRGYDAEGIHGDLTQRNREQVLKKFRAGNLEVLVATDVAARGLDVSGVSHVYNFDIPQDAESYVHRVGRTGRAGKTGLALTFATPRETDHLKSIERTTKRKMERKAIPNLDEVLEGKQQQTIDELVAVIGQGGHHVYKNLAQELIEEHDSVTVLSAALKMITKEPDETPVQLTAEAPLRAKKNHSKSPRSGGGGGGRGRQRRDGGGYNKDNRNKRRKHN